jgi:toxin ParE1/3/4
VKVRYTPAAQDDVIGIAEYSFEQWGAERAENYIEGVDRAAHQLPELLGISRPVEGYPQLRRMQIDRHMLFFRIVDDVIEVVRILHERMLPEEHL